MSENWIEKLDVINDKKYDLIGIISITSYFIDIMTQLNKKFLTVYF